MHKTNGLKGQTRKHMERMHALDKTTRRTDGLTNCWIRFSYDLKYYADLDLHNELQIILSLIQ